MRTTRKPPLSGRATAAVASAVAALAALTSLGACTAGGSATSAVSDAKSVPGEGSAVPSAPPGKYQTLPQPCDTVGLDLLKKLVPGAKDYAGVESLTYDTDRRVGCGWRGLAGGGTARSLTVDLVRVVSYDPAVSDEVQAEGDFAQQAAAASIPLPPTGGATPAQSGTPTGGAAGGGTASGRPGPGAAADLGPRRLTNVGNAAFIDDVLVARPKGVRRDVTLVFRTANVLVTVVYAQSTPIGAPPAPSADLQEGAQQVAALLERRVGR